MGCNSSTRVGINVCIGRKEREFSKCDLSPVKNIDHCH